MSDTFVRRFEFHKTGNSARRDRGTQPRNLLLGFTEQMRTIEYHRAGDDSVRARPASGALEDTEFLSGFTPMHAARIGVACERTRATDTADRVREMRRAATPK